MSKIVVVAHIKQSSVTYYTIDIYGIFCFLIMCVIRGWRVLLIGVLIQSINFYLFIIK